MEPTKLADRQVDISACLEAVSMYNGDYHCERDNYIPPVPQPEPYVPQPNQQPRPRIVPRLVPLWEYLCGVIVKGIDNLFRAGLWIGVALILANCAQNILDVNRAQPTFRTRIDVDPTTHESSEHILGVEASPYPLPEDYVPVNQLLYAELVLGTILCYAARTVSRRRAQKIPVSAPITRANTAHLPAIDTLVRASTEPTQTQKAVLLRPALEKAERHEEQLLRASQGQE